MYVPIGQRGQGSSQAGGPQQQVAAQQGAGIAAAIRSADASLQAKRKEAQRQYENAQTMMRNDLNTLSNFDVASLGGPGIAKGMKEYSDRLAQKIREVNDPVEASKLIQDFKRTYDYLKNAKTQNDEFRGEYMKAYNATGSELESMNSSLPAGQKVKVPSIQDVAERDKMYDRELIITDDFKVMVGDGQGGMMGIDEDERLVDPSAWTVESEAYDLGGIDGHAKSESTMARIDMRLGHWNEKDAREVYVDDILSINPNGQSGGNAVRNMTLQSLESRNLIPYMDDELKRQFEAGEFDMDKVYGVSYDDEGNRTFNVPSSELTKEEKLIRDALRQGEDLFVEESKHTIAERAKASSGGGKQTNPKIIRNGQGVPGTKDDNLPGESMGPAEDYNINAFRTPLKLAGSIVPGVDSPDGNYEITGAGYSPDGRLVATVRQAKQVQGTGFDEGTSTTTYENRTIYLTEIGEEAPVPGTQESEIFQYIMQDVDMAPVLAEDRQARSISILEEAANAPAAPVGDDDYFRDAYNRQQLERQKEKDQEAITEWEGMSNRVNAIAARYYTPDQIARMTPQELIDGVMNINTATGSDKEEINAINDRLTILVGTSPLLQNTLDNQATRADNAAQEQGMTQEARDAQQARSRNFVFNNPAGRALGYDPNDPKGLIEMLQGDNKPEEVPYRDRDITSRPIELGFDETHASIEALPQSRRDDWERSVANYRNEHGREISIRSKVEDGQVVFTDQRGVRIDEIDPIPLTPDYEGIKVADAPGGKGYNAPKSQKVSSFEAMTDVARDIGHPFPEAVAAQAALEGDWGASGLASKHNNFFGMKAGSAEKTQKALKDAGIEFDIVRMPTEEVLSEQEYQAAVSEFGDGVVLKDKTASGKYRVTMPGEPFLSFASPEEGFKAYNVFIKQNFPSALEAKNGKEYIQILKDNNYATAENYVQSVVARADSIGRGITPNVPRS